MSTTVPASAVVIGSGSAGRRHALALRRARTDVAVTVVRRPDSHQPDAALRTAGIGIVASLDDIDGEIDVGVVASPATLHAASVTALAGRAGVILLEKPAAASVADAAGIRDTIAAHRTPVVVGYHLRCTDTVTVVRELLGQGAVGEPVDFDLSTGQHLDLWRPGVDARRSVSARVDLGGGVLNELSHEIDAVQHLFGAVASVAATVRHDGAPTDGVVDTVADLDVRTIDDLAGTVHLDMTSDPPHRRWRISGDRATLTADLLTGRIEVVTGDRAEVVVDQVAPGERDRAEDRLIANVLAVADGSATPVCTLDDAVAVVGVVAAARQSAALGGAARRPIPVDSDHPVAGAVR